MKKILLIYPDLNYPGGGGCVAAWALQALVGHHEISVLTWQPADLSIANRRFGTDLKQREFRFFTVGAALRWTLSLIPKPLAHLTNQILYRKAKQLNQVKRFDAVISAMGEIEIGSRRTSAW